MKKIILLPLCFSDQYARLRHRKFHKTLQVYAIGDNNGFGAEIYQLGLNQKNRLEFDLGWKNNSDVDAIKRVALYQWVWNIDGGFNWYAGVGGGLSAWDYNFDGSGSHYGDDNRVYVFAGGDIGIEYRFSEAPITLSLDARPEIASGHYDDVNFEFDVGLGVTFRF